MNSTANPVTSDWKERARFACDAQKAEKRRADARQWKRDHEDVLKQRQRDAEALNKWINLLGIPASARCGVVVYDGYIFKHTTYWGSPTLRIDKPAMAFHKADPEEYGKILWSDAIQSIGGVTEALERLEAKHQKLTDYFAKKAAHAPQPSLEERNPRAMLTNTERDVIAYLEYLIKRIERQQVLTDTQALVFATAQFVNSVEVITLSED